MVRIKFHCSKRDRQIVRFYFCVLKSNIRFYYCVLKSNITNETKHITFSRTTYKSEQQPSMMKNIRERERDLRKIRNNEKKKHDPLCAHDHMLKKLV